jgi:hypothetical protein
MKIRIITLFVFALLVSTQISTAQSGWGIMGGLTFPSSGNLIDETSEIIDSNGSNNTGFNIGLFVRNIASPTKLKVRVLTIRNLRLMYLYWLDCEL